MGFSLTDHPRTQRLCAGWPTGRLSDECVLVKPERQDTGNGIWHPTTRLVGTHIIHPTHISGHWDQVGLATAERGRYDRIGFMSHRKFLFVLCERTHRSHHGVEYMRGTLPANISIFWVRDRLVISGVGTWNWKCLLGDRLVDIGRNWHRDDLHSMEVSHRVYTHLDSTIGPALMRVTADKRQNQNAALPEK